MMTDNNSATAMTMEDTRCSDKCSLTSALLEGAWNLKNKMANKCHITDSPKKKKCNTNDSSDMDSQAMKGKPPVVSPPKQKGEDNNVSLISGQSFDSKGPPDTVEVRKPPPPKSPLAPPKLLKRNQMMPTDPKDRRPVQKALTLPQLNIVSWIPLNRSQTKETL